ncbi:MAG: hypothetical protein Q4B72_13970, partial [Lachnospiraceae bacterium]|nr:hypothetical protein [Lachnospiraceae bacterium]
FTDFATNERRDTLVYLLEQLTSISGWILGNYDEKSEIASFVSVIMPILLILSAKKAVLSLFW